MFLIINICLSLGLLVNDIIPFLPANIAVWASGSTLLFIYLLIINVGFIFFWLMLSPKYAIFPFICLLLSYKQIYVLFAFHPSSTFIKTKKISTSVRVMTWNIQSFKGNYNYNDPKTITHKFLNVIDQFQPDILCLQEFRNLESNKQYNRLQDLKKKYPYCFFKPDYFAKNKAELGCAIFSKYPITEVSSYKLPNLESMLSITTTLEDKPIKIYNTHLQSYKFKPDDIETIKNVSSNQDFEWIHVFSVIKKIYQANKKRYLQADFIKKSVLKNALPVILCGDFNDIPNSYTYSNILKAGLNDVFLKTNFGFGSTYDALFQLLRIDYILFSNQFSPLQSTIIENNISDHKFIVADFLLNDF